MLKAKEKIILAKYNLMKELPFFGHLAYYLTTKETKSIEKRISPNVIVSQPLPRGATDGKFLYYNEDWINTINVEETAFFIAHEILHCALNHLTDRIGERNLKEWNAACDYVVNGIIKQQRNNCIKMIPNILINDDYNGMSVERVYPLIKEVKEDEFDCHLSQYGDGANEIDSEWRVRIVQAYNYARCMGKLPGGISDTIDKIIKPKVPWQEILRRFFDQFAKDDYTFMRPNKRTAHLGFYLPSFFSLSLGTFILAIDTSGSISQNDLQQFFSEINFIYSSYSITLHIIQCDADVQKHEILEPYGQLSAENYEVKGRGGTDFRPVFEFVEKEAIQATAMLFFTDGYGEFPKNPPDYPVLWISTTDCEYPEWCNVIRMEL